MVEELAKVQEMESKEMKEVKKTVRQVAKNNKLAVIRIRGNIRILTQIRDTLTMLNLNKVNTCIILENTPVTMGMIKKAKDYITWGNLDSETEKLLQKISNTSKKNVFRLQPPKKGFERKGIKKPFTTGGALGNRKVKINDLIKRML